MARRVLNYRTERQAIGAMKRLLKRYPVHPDCVVEVVSSTHWQYPFRFLIQVKGKDGSTAYWSAAK